MSSYTERDRKFILNTFIIILNKLKFHKLQLILYTNWKSFKGTEIKTKKTLVARQRRFKWKNMEKKEHT
jgi:pyridoxine/pyridoxamine 5'-phosphate oxidase